MAKKKKSRSKRVAPGKPLISWHLGIVAAMAALVCLLPWPAGGGDAAFWIRVASGMVGTILFFLLIRWIMKDSYPAFLSALILLSITAVWMPFRLDWRPWVLLLPLSFALGALLSYWDARLRSKQKNGFQHMMFASLAGVVSLGIIYLSVLVFLRLVRLGAFPMLTGLLIGAVAVGVVMLAVSAFVRRQPWDLVLGVVLYAVVWKLLALPGFESFL